MSSTVEANGVTLGVEHFGEAAAPLLLLAGGTTMLSWPDALCEALARGGRHVVRYDLRDAGASTTVDPEACLHEDERRHLCQQACGLQIDGVHGLSTNRPSAERDTQGRSRPPGSASTSTALSSTGASQK